MWVKWKTPSLSHHKQELLAGIIITDIIQITVIIIIIIINLKQTLKEFKSWVEDHDSL